MKITAVKTYPLEHPLSRGAGPSCHYFRSRTALVLKLETDEGITGWGETVALPGVRALIDEAYAPRLVGRNPLEHRRLWRELWGQNFGNGMAQGGVDIALHDLRGKALGLPVAELYGGRLRDRVPAYAAAMNYQEGSDPLEHYPREAAALAAQGFRAMKMRLGGQSVSRDVATAEAVREAVGPDICLMADGNGAYSLAAAIRMGRELERLRFTWFEEPLPQSAPDYAGYDELAGALDIAIAGGEALTQRGMFKELCARRAVDIVQPNACIAGGIGECLFVAELARLYGIQCTPHSWCGGLVIAANLHVLSLLPDSSWSRSTETPMLELDRLENPFRDELFRSPLELSDGKVSVPTGPGLGIEVDEEKLDYYRCR